MSNDANPPITHKNSRKKVPDQDKIDTFPREYFKDGKLKREHLREQVTLDIGGADGSRTEQFPLGIGFCDNLMPPAGMEGFSRTVKVVGPAPDVLAALGHDAYEKGELKKEYWTGEEITLAYPNPHSCWDKLRVRGSTTIDEFSKMFPNLELNSFSAVLGDIKEKGKDDRSTSCEIWPVREIIDKSLLPDLSLTENIATRQILTDKRIRDKQGYIGRFKDCKKAGSIDFVPPNCFEASGNTTMTEVCHKLSRIADAGKAEYGEKSFFSFFTNLESRKIFMLKASIEFTVIEGEFEGLPVKQVADVIIEF
jgi:hypothetical protein